MNVTCLENKHKKIPPKQLQQEQTHLPIKKKTVMKSHKTWSEQTDYF